MFFDVFYDLCNKKGVSCKRAAEEIGLSNSITTKWKKTGATPTGETLAKIADYFGVSVDSLIGKEEKTPIVSDGQKENPDQLALTGIEAEMVKLFRQFPGVEQKLLVIMMQNLYSVPADTRGPALETLQAFWKTIQKP